MTEIANPPSQTGAGSTHVSGVSSPAPGGSFRGERVEHVRNAVARLQEAAEELTFAKSERAGKRLTQRKLAGDRQQSALALDQARAYLKLVPDLEKEQKLSEFAEQLLRQKKHANPGWLRQRAQAFSDDPTHQFLALAHAHSIATARHATPDMVAGLQQAMDSLRAERGPAIQAGLNISAVAHRHSGTELGTTQELRDLYRDVVIDCGDINDAFERIVDGYPGRTFDEALQFLLNALGTDLACSSQTVPRPRLKQILNDMYQLKSLNSIHRQCDDLLRRTDSGYGANTGSTSTRNLMAELLGARSRAWQGADAFSGLPEKMGVADEGGAIYLLNGFKELVRFLPSKTFGEDQTDRERIMIAVQQALDLAIDREDFDD